jgi:serine/threonine-protein kinase
MGRAEAVTVEPEQARSKSGLTLGKYHLLAVLGRGGMAEVFLALSRGNMGFDKLAVIKRLREGMADDEAFRSMFLDEARLAARLNHPNVVHTYEVGEQDGAYYIAMEYLEGQPLNRVISEGTKRGTPLDPWAAARVVSDALAGLHHAHTLTDFDGRPLGIIHRDVSPHNLFITYEGTTKVVDFGIAKAALSSSETEVGVLKGKVAYMSPEQATHGPIDARSDVFAMGIVLWELLTQRRLMIGETAASTIHRLLTSPVPPASSLARNISPSLDAIVDRALSKDVNQRFESALAMREAIEAYLASTGRAPRAEEIGRQVAEMFSGVREELKHQIQEQVEALVRADAPSGDSEVRASSRAAIGREGTLVSASKSLPVLAAAQSSSGLVPKGSASVVSAASAPSLAAVPSGPVAATAPQGTGVSGRTLGVVFALLVVVVVATTVVTQVLLSMSRQVAQKPPEVTEFVTPKAAPEPPPPALPSVVAAPPAVASAAQAAPVESAVAEVHPAHPAKSSTRSHAAALPVPSASPAPPDSLGFLTFDTYPWTRVSEGATQLGTTPLVRVGLSAGTHTLTLDNPDQGIHQTYSVTVKAGEATTKRLGLK